MAEYEFRTTVDDCFKVAKATLAISTAKSIPDLNLVGERIAKSDFSENDRKVLRHLWRQRKADILNPPQQDEL